MKILLLSDIYSEHTEKWALGLAESGIEVGLFSFNKASYTWYKHKNIRLLFEPEEKINADSTFTKLFYPKHVSRLKKIIREFQPDILHAHYATSYGLIGALSDFHPFVISAWGTDVMKFPDKNFIAKSILHYNFRKADLICATSYTIENYIGQVIKKPVVVIPFGIDVNEFSPKKVTSVFQDTDFVIGSIKPLESIYNISVMIKAFAILNGKYKNLKLLIIGEGTAKEQLQKECEELNITKDVKFTGRIPHSEISRYYNMLNVLVNISEYESFGVSVVEAMACEKPVIVTNVGGLKEIVSSDAVGLKVEIGNVEQTVNAIEKLLTDKKLYSEIALNARQYVVKKYNWKDNLQQMIDEYNKLLKQSSS